MSRAVDVCVCVFLQTVSSLGVYSSRTSHTFTSSHLLTLLPKSQHHGVLLLNPSSRFFLSFSIFTFLFQDPQSQICASVYFFSVCAQRKKRWSLLLSPSVTPRWSLYLSNCLTPSQSPYSAPRLALPHSHTHSRKHACLLVCRWVCDLLSHPCQTAGAD